MASVSRVATTVVTRRRLVIGLFLVITAVLGTGMTALGMADGNLGAESNEMEAYTFIHAEFGDDEAERTLLIVHGEDILAKESLLDQLRAQEALVTNETVATAIDDNSSVLGIANAIAVAGMFDLHQGPAQPAVGSPTAGADAHAPDSVVQPVPDLEDLEFPPLAQQREQLASMEQAEIDATLSWLLATEATADTVSQLLPADFEEGSGPPTATLVSITHSEGSEESHRLAAATATQTLAGQELSQPPTVFSEELRDFETSQSIGDSLTLLGPFVLLLVFLALGIAFRDVLDIILGLLGVTLVLVWTAGFMGLVGIDFHFLFVAIPLLLVGLALDFAIHLLMRYREGYQTNGTGADSASHVQDAMKLGLAGVISAFLWVTVTTSTGFLSNLVSTIPQIREFGVALAFGIVSTCVVFTTFIPALKTELDSGLVSWGVSRNVRAFGTTGPVRRLLDGAGTLTTTAPKALLVVVLLVSLAGGYGATQIDTDSDRTMFVPDSPPGWTQQLPDPFAPGEYTQRDAMLTLDQQFQREETEGWILLEGNVTEPSTLEAIAPVHERAADHDAVESVISPITVMEQTAEQNESFRQTFVAADSSGDGIPDQNLGPLYEDFLRVAPAAAADVLNGSTADGYDAIRVRILFTPGVSDKTIADETRSVTGMIESDTHRVTPTGTAVAAQTAQNDSRDAALEGVSITIIVVFGLLTLGYRRHYGSWTLGSVTLVPMVLLLTWVAGTMAAFDVPLNALTAVIASFTVALGIDYCIHISERFLNVYQRTGILEDSIRESVTNTGGALAAGALTTASAFGILVLAINPALQQFGFVMGLTIVYAFLASVIVLPCLLVLWTRLTDPDFET